MLFLSGETQTIKEMRVARQQNKREKLLKKMETLEEKDTQKRAREGRVCEERRGKEEEERDSQENEGEEERESQQKEKVERDCHEKEIRVLRIKVRPWRGRQRSESEEEADSEESEEETDSEESEGENEEDEEKKGKIEEQEAAEGALTPQKGVIATIITWFREQQRRKIVKAIAKTYKKERFIKAAGK